VFEWRLEQERKLAARLEGSEQVARTMDDDALRRFVMHFERLTRYMLAEMPQRADLVIELDGQRRIVGIGDRSSRV
jgi:D-glycerate 3-kinase